MFHNRHYSVPTLTFCREKLHGMLPSSARVLVLLCAMAAMSLFLWACGSQTPAELHTSPETDREALVAFYHATDGPNWRENRNWLADAPLERWYGVSADENGRVTELRLAGNELSGSVPPELGRLEKLRVLDLTATKTLTEVTISFGSKKSDDNLSSDPTKQDINQLMKELEQRRDNRDPISKAIDQIAEQASDPSNTRVVRNHLSGCIPGGLRKQLDLNASDLGGLSFCDKTNSQAEESERTASALTPSVREAAPIGYGMRRGAFEASEPAGYTGAVFDDRSLVWEKFQLGNL